MGYVVFSSTLLLIIQTCICPFYVKKCRKDSFITHRAFCDALAEESARMSANQSTTTTTTNPLVQSLFLFPTQQQQNIQNHMNPWFPSQQENPNPSNLAPLTTTLHHNIKPEAQNFHLSSSSPTFLHHPKTIIASSPFRDLHVPATSPYLSATALLQKAATVGVAAITGQHAPPHQLSMSEFGSVTTQLDSVVPDHFINVRGIKNGDDRHTRDFLGLTGDGNGGAVDVSVGVKDMLTFTGVDYQQPHYNEHNHNSLFKSQQQGFGFIRTTTAPESWGNC